MNNEVSQLLLWFERPQVKRNILILLFLFIAATSALTVYRVGNINRSTEFRQFRNLSRTAVLENGQQYQGHIRAYPPFFAVAFLPFSLGPTMLGAAFFYAVSLVGYAASLWWLCRTVYGDGRDGLTGLIILSGLVGLQSFTNIILRCETDILVLTAVAAGLFLIIVRKRPISGGFWLGFAAAFKIIPVLFGVFLLCQRQWKAAIGMALGGIFFTVLVPMTVWGPTGVWQRHMDWLNKVVIPYREIGPQGLGITIRPSNQSLTAALHRFLRPVGQGEQVEVNMTNLPSGKIENIAGVIHIVLAVLFIAFWIYTYRNNLLAHQQLTLFATVPIAMLLLSDVSLVTHHITLMLAMIMLLGRYSLGGLEKERVGRMIWLVPIFVAAMVLLGIPLLKALSPLLLVTLLTGGTCVRLALCDYRHRQNSTL
jgi:hypothetical protein